MTRGQKWAFLAQNITSCYWSRWRHGGIMVSALGSELSRPGSSTGQGNCVVFLGKTLYSHSASFLPWSINGTEWYRQIVRVTWKKIMMTVCDLWWTSIPSRGSSNTRSHSLHAMGAIISYKLAKVMFFSRGLTVLLLYLQALLKCQHGEIII